MNTQTQAFHFEAVPFDRSGMGSKAKDKIIRRIPHMLLEMRMP